MLRTLIALACLAGLSTAAHAEPIQWTYTGGFTSNAGTEFVTAGSGGRPDAEAPGGMRPYTGFTELTQAANAGPQGGSARILLGSTPGFTQFFWADGSGPEPAAGNQFVASVTLTDTASGASETVSVVGTAESRDSWLGLPADLNLPAVDQLWAFPGQQVTLGGNRYTVKFGELKVNPRLDSGLGGLWDRLEVYADVQVSPAAETPEPATLALAGIGLFGLAVARIRRRTA